MDRTCQCLKVSISMSDPQCGAESDVFQSRISRESLSDKSMRDHRKPSLPRDSGWKVARQRSGCNWVETSRFFGPYMPVLFGALKGKKGIEKNAQFMRWQFLGFLRRWFGRFILWLQVMWQNRRNPWLVP